MSYMFRGFALQQKGEFAQALPWFERSVHLCETTRLLAWLPFSYSMWGWGLARSGQALRGLPYLQQGPALHESMGIKTYRSHQYFRWAEGLLLAGNIQEARPTADRALELATATGDRGLEAWALYLLGEIASHPDPPDAQRAEDHYRRAMTLADRLGMRPLLAHCHLGLGKLDRRIGKGQDAQEHLTAATAMYRDMDMRFWLEQAQSELTVAEG